MVRRVRTYKQRNKRKYFIFPIKILTVFLIRIRFADTIITHADTIIIQFDTVIIHSGTAASFLYTRIIFYTIDYI